MTFSASSTLAWCLTSTTVSPSLAFLLRVSRLQFARPAVEFNFRLHTIFTPPELLASSATFPPVIFSSSSRRNASATSHFRASKALRASSAALSRFFAGLLRGEAEGDGESLSDKQSVFERLPVFRGERGFLGDRSVLRGEYWSFHSLITDCDQKASRLGLYGGVGMRSLLLEGETRRDLEGLAGSAGGVVGRCGGGSLAGESLLSGLLWRDVS